MYGVVPTPFPRHAHPRAQRFRYPPSSILHYISRFLCFLSSRSTAVQYSTYTRSYLHVKSTPDPWSSHPQNLTVSFSAFPSVRIRVIALAWRCITLRCLSLVAFAFLAAPVVRFVLFSLYFTTAALRSPAAALPHFVYRTSPCAPMRRSHSHTLRQRRELVVHSYAQCPGFRRRCRCHVTRTYWSRAFAASSSLLRTPHTPTYHLFPHTLANDRRLEPPRSLSCTTPADCAHIPQQDTSPPFPWSSRIPRQLAGFLLRR